MELRNIVYQSSTAEPTKLLLEVEELSDPVLRGASMRTHRVWVNGKIANGAGYQPSLDAAVRACRYLEKQSLADKLSYQNKRVEMLETKLGFIEMQRLQALALIESPAGYGRSEIRALLEAMQ